MLSEAARADLERLTAILGSRLRLFPDGMEPGEEALVAIYLRDLLLVPSSLWSRLTGGMAGTRLEHVWIGKGPVCAFPGFEDYANEPIPGSPGRTYLDVPCSYNWERHTILLGSEPRSEIDKAESAAMHEVGHALGNILGYDDDYRLKAEFGRLSARLPTSVGMREFFALSFEHVIMKSRLGMSETFLSAQYKQFLRDVVLRGKAPQTKEAGRG